MATVYLALDRRLDREVAVKVMHAHLADDEQFTVRFIREARAAARLSHPNVVQVYDQGAEGDLLYLAMEHLRGRTLREVLAERRVLTAREALTVIEPLLDALAAAHRVGIVHRDVKPENVILTDDGRVKVADFGLARAATASTSTTGVLLGTVGYLAPELVVRGVADARSDVYAAGIMLFEMITGRQPFSGEVPIQVAYRHVNEQVPAPSTVVSGLAPGLDAVVAAATARDPDDRPADAGEWLAQVQTAHATLSTAQLDARPVTGDAGRAGGRRPVADTEIFRADGEPTNRTRALPELTVHRSAAGSPAVRNGSPGSDGSGQGAAGALAPRAPVGEPGTAADGAAPGTEDAALAAMLHRRRVIGVTALLLVITLALSLAGVAWYFAAGPGAFTPTTKVTGLQVAQAQQQLKTKGLRSSQQNVFDDAAAGGTVVSTDPEAGRPVRKDGTVILKVSQGPAVVKVPVVVGQQLDAARAALTAGHLTVQDVQEAYDDQQPKGAVLSVKPDQGEQVKNGTGVSLTVSKGPQPVDVPDLVNKTQSAAEAILAQLKLGVGYATPRNDDTVPAGSVLAQSPDSGTLVPGQKVTLTLSKGPVLVPVPSVIGMQYPQARSTLEGAGFTVRRNNFMGGFFGTVRLQNPPGGSQAPKGSTIVLTVV
jgi:serine/threonine-protein kinase